ncbi:MAG TPA: hypothetical protein VH583_10355 [Vicinamibacterales bacterium]|jgi:hypothetical protein
MRRTSAIVAVLGAAMLVSTVHATVVVPTSLTEMSRDAVAIARGRVASVTGRWTDDRKTIETIVALEVDGYLKGSLGSTLQFRVPGGHLGRFRSVVVGAPDFAVDDRVVVFLGASGPMVPFVLGFNQGVYRLALNAGGTQWLVTPPPILPGTAAGPIQRGDSSRRPLPLQDFEREVRALAGGLR